LTALEVVAGPAAGQRVELEAQLLLGRGEDGAGALGGDPELSRRHAEIVPLGDGRLLLEDLASTNGTWVNGVRIPRPTVLAPGDEIAVGGSVLRVLGSDAAAPAAPAQTKQLGLRVVEGWAPGTHITVGDAPLVLGRETAPEAFEGDPAVGEEHARLTPLGEGRVLVEDLGSGFGTRVRGEPIPAPTVLSLGDRFQVGGQTLEVIELAGRREASDGGDLGGVHRLPEGFFRRLGARAPVSGQEVFRTYLVALGWAVAANLLIRTFAVGVAGVPHNLTSIRPVPFVLATILPVTFNAFGFSKLFRRPDHTTVKRYLMPTFGVPALFLIVNLLRMNHRGFADFVTTIGVTVVPVMICAPLMLRLREHVVATRLRHVQG
jgi:pSer/pThr/pTyr-binding forkhead associated (FHA) protein